MTRVRTKPGEAHHDVIVGTVLGGYTEFRRAGHCAAGAGAPSVRKR